MRAAVVRPALLSALVQCCCGATAVEAHAPPEVRSIVFEGEGMLIFRDGDGRRDAALTCAPDSETARRCELPWSDWRNEQGTPGTPTQVTGSDAGAPPAGPQLAKRSATCSALAQPEAGGCGTAAALLLLCVTFAASRRWI